MAAGRPYTVTRVTQHTLWAALTGETPPLALPATPIGNAALDSRDVTAGDLFVALAGTATDGHAYVGAALAHGAQALIVEERGRDVAMETGAALVDCTRGRWALTATLPASYQASQPVAYVVDDSVLALQKLGAFQRLHRANPALRVIGVTGSVGKTSTKELTTAVMRRHFQTWASPGNLNNEQGLPLTLLGLGPEVEVAVLEMGMYDLGEIERLCVLARPDVGIVTNVGPVHLSRLGTIERIAQAKAELVRALPAAQNGGTAILTWDDERVRAMADVTQARIFRYGLTPAADLWAEDVQSNGMEGIRFRFCYRQPGQARVESLVVKVPLLGRHSVHTALCAAAAGLVEGLSWEEIVAGMQSIPSQLRLVVTQGINGCTVIDDTYNASPAGTIAALNLLADLTPKGKGRRVAVLGDMRELGSYTDEGHKLVGRRVADVADVLVTFGELGKAIGAEAQAVKFDPARIHMMQGHVEAVALLRTVVRQDDLVLVKGSRAVGMEAIVGGIVASDSNGSSEHQAEAG